MSNKKEKTEMSDVPITNSLDKLNLDGGGSKNTQSKQTSEKKDLMDTMNNQWKTIGNKIKKYKRNRNIPKDVFEAGLDAFFHYVSKIIMGKIRYTVEKFNPHFEEGTDSFIKKLIVYSYNSDSEFKFKHNGKEYKLKIFSDLIKKCNRKNKNGEWLNNSFMDKLIKWAEPSGRDIKFTSCRKYNWETKKPIPGKYIIMAQWTYHRSEEENDDDDDSTSNEEEESSE